MHKTCPICGAGELAKHMNNEPFEYKGRLITIPNYITYKCNICEESIVDESTLKLSGKLLKKLKREVDNLLPCTEIKRIREKLGFTQEKLSEILGGGLKGFARYESGQVTQSKAMDNLLRILDRYPHVIDVINTNDTVRTMRIESKIVDINKYRKERYKPKDKAIFSVAQIKESSDESTVQYS